MILHAALFLSPAQAQTLDVLGECPGPIELTVAGLTPRGAYAIVSSSGTGTAAVPAGQPCAGTVLGVSGVGLTLRAVRNAGVNGGETFTPAVPAAGCGLALQVLDVASCTPTNVAFLPRTAVSSTISDVQQLAHAVYDVVNVSGVVTATDAQGVWLQNGPSAQYGGLYVFLAPGWDQAWFPISRGDVLEVQGEYREYYGLTEINVADSPARSVSLLSSGAEPAPYGLTLAALMADSEPWEGVLVRLNNVTVASLPNAYGEWTITNGAQTIVVDDQVYDASAGLAVGDPLQLVQGPLSYSFSTWRILPRDANDVR